MAFYKTRDDIVTELRVALRDNGTNKQFSDAEMQQALRDSVEFYSEKLFVTDVWEDSDRQVEVRIDGGVGAGGTFTLKYGSTATATTTVGVAGGEAASIQTNLRAAHTDLSYINCVPLEMAADGSHEAKILIILNGVPRNLDNTIQTLTIGTDSTTGSPAPTLSIAERHRSVITNGQFLYLLPDFIHRVSRVERKLFTKTTVWDVSSDVDGTWVGTAFRHERGSGGENNYLYLPGAEHLSTDTPIRVHYERPIMVPAENEATVGGTTDVLSEDAVIEVAKTGQDVYEWKMPQWFFLDGASTDEVVRADATHQGATGTVLYPVARGLEGTRRADHASGTLYALLVTNTLADYAKIRERTKLYLYKAATTDGNDSRASIWITLYQNSVEELRQMDHDASSRRSPGQVEHRRRRPRIGPL